MGLTAPSSIQAAPPESFGIVIDAPPPATRVNSPVTIRGSLLDTGDRVTVAQVLSPGVTGALMVRGNQRLEPNDDGRFETQLTFHLDEPGEGVVEVAVIDPTSGTVLDRARQPVILGVQP